MRPPLAYAWIGLLSAALLAGCGSSGRDADHDTMYDSAEKAGWDVTVDSMTERTRHHVTSDPAQADTDGDGVPDNEEYFIGTDPRVADTDGDGLSDCQEVRHTNRTECEHADFNGPFDGGTGTDPTKADSDPGASVYILDGRFTDHTSTLANGLPETGDGISDGEERAGYSIHLANGNTRFVKTDPRNGDSDADHLDDGEERFLYSSDPTVADTDGDGCIDGIDPLPAVEERYRPGLRSFTLAGPLASADLRLTMLVANVGLEVPQGSSVAVENGQTRDLSAYDPAPVHSDSCTYTPRAPWVQVQVAAADMRQGQVRSLDIFGQTASPTAAAGQPGAVWWNVQANRLSWSPDGAASWDAAEGVAFVGADGTLSMAPAVVGR